MMTFRGPVDERGKSLEVLLNMTRLGLNVAFYFRIAKRNDLSLIHI